MFGTALVALGLLPATAVAQACLGNPSFAVNHLQLAGGVAFSQDVSTFGVTFTGGSESGFAGLGVGGVNLDGSAATTFHGSAGYQVRASSGGGVQVCPLLALEYGTGPKDLIAPGSDQTTRGAQLALAIGGETMVRSEFRLIPTLIVGFNHLQTRTESPDSDVSDSFGSIGAGVGIVLGNRLSLKPSITQRISAANEDLIFGLGVTLNFGGRR